MDSPIAKAGIVVLVFLVLIVTVHRYWSESSSEDVVIVETTSSTTAPDREHEPVPAKSGEKSAHSRVSETPATSDCPTTETATDAMDDDEWFLELQQISDRLAAADSAELLLAAALLRGFGNSDEGAIVMQRAYELDPNSPLIAWNRLRSCAGATDSVCEFDAIRDSAVEVDNSNGAMWLAVASEYLERNQTDKALEATRHAATAARFDQYWSEQIMLLERGFAAATDWTYPQRVAAATGLASAMVYPMSHISQQCQEPDSNAAVWSELCDQLGKKMFDEGRTYITQAIGFSIRKMAARLDSSPVGLAQLLKLESEYKGRFTQHTSDSDANNLLANDEQVLRSYVEYLSAHGEFEAMERLRIDVARLKATPGYDQCNFVANPYGF